MAALQGHHQATISAIHDELYDRTLDGGWPDAVLTPGVRVRTAGRVGTSTIELHVEHEHQHTRSRLTTNAVVLATGYRERSIDTLLADLQPQLCRDTAGRPLVDGQQRLVLDLAIKGSIYVQNAERHTHGVGAPDLGLAAWRGAVILNSVTGRLAFALPRRTAFTTFGLDPAVCGGGQRAGKLSDQRDRHTVARTWPHRLTAQDHRRQRVRVGVRGTLGPHRRHRRRAQRLHRPLLHLVGQLRDLLRPRLAEHRGDTHPGAVRLVQHDPRDPTHARELLSPCILGETRSHGA